MAFIGTRVFSGPVSSGLLGQVTSAFVVETWEAIERVLTIVHARMKFFYLIGTIIMEIWLDKSSFLFHTLYWGQVSHSLFYLLIVLSQSGLHTNLIVTCVHFALCLKQAENPAFVFHYHFLKHILPSQGLKKKPKAQLFLNSLIILYE